ncbi:hypothetical protein FRB90_001171 [Tulasnella sp. 427]|nr:hypothetical protein FRB90_001171 [Tulasnella sp. 427]
MFRAAIRLNLKARGPVSIASLHNASTTSKTLNQSQNWDVAQQLEKDASRILKVVQRRVEERERLLREDAEDQGSSAAHIQRAKTLKELEPLHQAWARWTEARSSFSETSALLEDPDPDLRALAAEERTSLTEVLSEHVKDIFPSLLVPPSATKHFSAIVELKSGVGGDEAALFVSDVLKMYTRLAAMRGFRVETVSISQLEGSKGSGGGIKEAIIEVQGEGSYDIFRWESGVHRVQRVPATESQGRVHTSTITVMVLPTSDAPEETDADFKIDEKDVKTEVMRARGAGGQHVNRTESAVRLTHIPTGISVSMQDSRSQHSNRAKAWQILRARLLDRKLQEEQAERRDNRRSIIKGADRSEKIRTYNFPQNRVTDHRIGLTITNLDAVLEGEELQYVIDELQKDHEESVMAELLNE